jgi:hypothetical protein
VYWCYLINKALFSVKKKGTARRRGDLFVSCLVRVYDRGRSRWDLAGPNLVPIRIVSNKIGNSTN